MIEKEITVNKLKASYLESGSGEKTVVCFPGWPFGKSMYVKIFEEKGLGNLKTLAIDYPGWGKSELINEKLGYDSIGKYAIDFMDALEIEKAYLLGVSFGGALALSIASQWPERVRGVVASAPPIFFRKYVNIRQKATFEICDRLPLIKDVFFQQLMEKKRWAWEVIFGNIPDEEYGSLSSTVFEELRLVKKRAMDETLHQIMATDLREILANIKVPVLLLTGDKDYMLPDSREASLKIPNSKLLIIEDGDHDMVVRKSGDFVNKMKGFFNES